MAFCKHCGADLKDAKFCPGCGATANGEVVPNDRHSVNADIRRQSLAEMSDMLKHFGVKKAEYDKQNALEDEILKRESKGYFGWLICGIIFALISFWLYKLGNDAFNQVIGLSILPITFIVIFVLLRKNNAKKLHMAQVKHKKVTEELEAHYAAYGYCPLGIDYTDPDILAQINDVIRQGRVTTPEAALNLLLEELRDRELKEKMDAQLQATEEVRKEVQRTGKAARKAANYASANFWFK